MYFLSSGHNYRENINEIKIVSVDNNISRELKTFDMVNSPVLAPVQQSIKNTKAYLEDTTIYLLLKKFIEAVGGFDVIHFNNLEGLSLSVLKLKEDFPQTKFVYSLHNYFPLCTQVTLWQTRPNSIGHICTKKDYSECANCYPKINYDAERLARKYKQFREFSAFKGIYSQHFPDSDDPKIYREFEERNIFYINKYIDINLAVSERVKDIFSARGLNEKKIVVSYIGTDVAEIQRNDNCADINSDPFKIIYMGYMNFKKGFYFFLQSLYNMPSEAAKNIVVTFATKYHPEYNKREVAAIENLKTKFRDVILLDGYKREEFESLLRDQNLGVVPVLWEDNLPQVAIEQIAYGVPIICSDLGGASELHSRNPDFTFKAGDLNDFVKKLENILNNRNLLKEYWSTVMPLMTMEKHVKFLESIYR